MGTSKDNISDSTPTPDYYISGRKYEPRKVIDDWGLDWELGSALKYISRAGRKPGNSTLKDLWKAKDFINFEIEKLGGDPSKRPEEG